MCGAAVEATKPPEPLLLLSPRGAPGYLETICREGPSGAPAPASGASLERSAGIRSATGSLSSTPGFATTSLGGPSKPTKQRSTSGDSEVLRQINAPFKSPYR